MSVHDVVEFIQSNYPPQGAPPAPGEASQAILIDRPDGNLPDLPPTERHPRPEWLDLEQAVPIADADEVRVEDGVPAAQQPPPGPVHTLAFYLPFHFYLRHWGIYLRASGIVSVASMLSRASPLVTTPDCAGLAKDILHQHERSHFHTEVACARAEVAAGQLLYPSYFRDRWATTLEEALSNAYSFRKALRDQPPTIRGAVESWMLSQGPGYRHFQRWLSDSDFRRGRRLATCQMTIRVPGPSWDKPSEFLYAYLGSADAPTYMVLDVPYVRVLRPFPKYVGMRILVHTREHPPPHVHVEIPPGRPYTRLEWPKLQPLGSDPALSASQRENLEAYLGKYGEPIERKIEQVQWHAA